MRLLFFLLIAGCSYNEQYSVGQWKDDGKEMCSCFFDGRWQSSRLFQSSVLKECNDFCDTMRVRECKK